MLEFILKRPPFNFSKKLNKLYQIIRTRKKQKVDLSTSKLDITFFSNSYNYSIIKLMMMGLEVKILLKIICSAATYISKSVEYASEV
jgi:hypothetical protein